MINHVSVGVSDLKAARRFYDPALSALGYKCLTEGEAYLGYCAAAPVFWTPLFGPHPCSRRPPKKTT